jgi:hypothetical protein
VLALGLLGGGTPATARVPAAAVAWTVSKSPSNTFTLVAGSHVFTGTPTATRLGNKTYVAWATHTGSTFGVSYVTMSASSGTPSAVQTALSGLGSVSDHITVVPEGPFPNDTTPLLVYTGTSCVLGALGPSTPWAVQTWSLSNDCVNPVPSAAEDGAGTIGASWPGSGGVRYRLGVSPTIPATGTDATVPVGSTVFKTGMAVDLTSQHFYVGWAREFGGANDGFYAQDITGGGSPLKMPSTGTKSINAQPPIGRMAMAPNGSGGVYLAACSNANACHLLVWKVGATTAHAVPGAKEPYIAALAPGPGTLWVAWGDQKTNTVKVTRSNPQGTMWEPVTTLHTPCAEHEIVNIAGPNAQPADIALECVANKTLQPAVYVAHVLPQMLETLKPAKVSNAAKHTVTVTLTDAGDPVPAADVTFHGTTKSTNSKGIVSFSVPAGFPTGHHPVVAKKSPFYQPATATLTVTH